MLLKTFVDFGFKCYSIDMYCLLDSSDSNMWLVGCKMCFACNIKTYLLCCQKFWSSPADPRSCSFGNFQEKNGHYFGKRKWLCNLWMGFHFFKEQLNVFGSLTLNCSLCFGLSVVMMRKLGEYLRERIEGNVWYHFSAFFFFFFCK